MEFIPKAGIPKDRLKDVTYGRFVVSYRPQKLEKHRTRLTVGGDRINYPFDVSTPTSDLSTIKMLWNSVLSTPGAKFCGADIANFYLKTPMKRPEFMRLPYNIIPQEIKTAYNLDKLVHNGFVYTRIIRGMYGLPHAGLIANELLKERLDKAGYYECQFTPGLWRHVWRPITFALVVDDFGVKYNGDVHANHLISTLKRTTTLQSTGKATYLSGSNSSGTTKIVRSIRMYPATRNKPSTSTNIQHPSGPNMPQQRQRRSNTAPRCRRQSTILLPTSLLTR